MAFNSIGKYIKDLRTLMGGGTGATPAVTVAAALADNVSNPTTQTYGAAGLLWSPADSVYRRDTANHEGTVLASAARTTQGNGANTTNYGGTRLKLILDITVASGTGGLIVRIASVDPITGSLLYQNADVAAITTTGRFMFEFGPGESTAPPAGTGYSHQRVAGSLAPTWRATVTVGDASSYTYSLAYQIVR